MRYESHQIYMNINDDIGLHVYNTIKYTILILIIAQDSIHKFVVIKTITI